MTAQGGTCMHRMRYRLAISIVRGFSQQALLWYRPKRVLGVSTGAEALYVIQFPHRWSPPVTSQQHQHCVSAYPSIPHPLTWCKKKFFPRTTKTQALP
eukprot:366390-Chlamydomonas_euryale.AAC.6